MTDDRPTPDEAWDRTEKVFKRFGRWDGEVQDTENARDHLFFDLERYKGTIHPGYEMTPDIRDRLLAHARRDAAHATIVALRLSDRVRLLTWLQMGTLAALAVVIYLLVTALGWLTP